MDAVVARRVGMSDPQLKSFRAAYGAGQQQIYAVERAAAAPILNKYKGMKPKDQAERDRITKQVTAELKAASAKIRPRIIAIIKSTEKKLQGIMTAPQRKTFLALQGSRSFSRPSRFHSYESSIHPRPLPVLRRRRRPRADGGEGVRAVRPGRGHHGGARSVQAELKVTATQSVDFLGPTHQLPRDQQGVYEAWTKDIEPERAPLYQKRLEGLSTALADAVLKILNDEQRLRLRQIVLQQTGAEALEDKSPTRSLDNERAGSAGGRAVRKLRKQMADYEAAVQKSSMRFPSRRALRKRRRTNSSGWRSRKA